MKILVVGKGGREHALCETLRRGPSGPRVFATPGSAGMSGEATPVPAANLDEILAFATREAVDLIVAGEESYLAKGLADRGRAAGIPVWGPLQTAAQLESSKLYAKSFMSRHRLPTGGYTVATSVAEARAAITSLPTVLKYNGLAAGKGVAVCHTAEEVEEFLDVVFTQRRFGTDQVYVEEYLTGPEVSIIVAISGDRYHIFPPARDNKRLEDGDRGPNTGGMGAAASFDILDAALLARIEREMVAPAVRGLAADNLDYRGFLYFGVMLTPSGPRLLEFNVRFGDPEAQAVLPLVDGDFARYLLEGARGNLDPSLISFQPGWSVAVVAAGRDYPHASNRGDRITGLENAAPARVYHAGTEPAAGGGFQTNGGRILAVSARAPTRREAVARAYAGLDALHFDGKRCRRDIGLAHFE